MTRSSREVRVVYRSALDGRAFKVQENRATSNGTNSWRTIAGYTNLVFALEEFPTAAPDAVAVRHQRELEESRHTVERTNSDRAQCARCGHKHGEVSA